MAGEALFEGRDAAGKVVEGDGGLHRSIRFDHGERGVTVPIQAALVAGLVVGRAQIDGVADGAGAVDAEMTVADDVVPVAGTDVVGKTIHPDSIRVFERFVAVVAEYAHGSGGLRGASPDIRAVLWTKLCVTRVDCKAEGIAGQCGQTDAVQTVDVGEEHARLVERQATIGLQ